MNLNIFDWLFNRYMAGVKNKYEEGMEGLKHKYEKEMEELKHKYDVDLSVLQSQLNNLLFVSNMQYEREYEIYQKLWELEEDCIGKYIDIISDDLLYYLIAFDFDERNEKLSEGAKKLVDVINEIDKQSSKMRPFIDEYIYQKLDAISKHALEIVTAINGCIDELMGENIYGDYKKLKAIIKEECAAILKAKEEASNSIRKYLNDLRIKPGAN